MASTKRFSLVVSLMWAIAAVAQLGCAACSKKGSASADQTEAFKDIEKTFDSTEPPPGERKPVEGADLERLSDTEKQRFNKLADELPSPCGKAHSLRTSRNTDAECVRARFAVDFVVELLKAGANDSDVKEFYGLRYREREQNQFSLSATPHRGPSDAPVVLVEFFDYGCPSCARFKPLVEEAAEAYPTEVALYYKHFPLEGHPDSGPAAQAAMAAAKQGKFKEMHDLLFEDQLSHKPSDLRGYATKLGLDMKRYEVDFAAAEALVAADRQEGEKAGITGTPTLFINGRLYEGPEMVMFLKMWIDEELAVSR